MSTIDSSADHYPDPIQVRQRLESKPGKIVFETMAAWYRTIHGYTKDLEGLYPYWTLRKENSSTAGWLEYLQKAFPIKDARLMVYEPRQDSLLVSE